MDLMVFQREREDQSSLTDYKGGGGSIKKLLPVRADHENWSATDPWRRIK